MIHPTTSATLQVPGAHIYYEVRGSGPLLLLIAGGPQDAGVFAELSQHLARHYTVVSYDPRGNSRSSFTHEVEELSIEVQARDAAALIDVMAMGPAHVFGTSGGAQISLHLARHHPDRVRTVVAHEPPVLMLLDDPGDALATAQELYDTYRREGVDAAMQRFFADNGLEGDAEHGDDLPGFEMPPESAETFLRVASNFEYWLAHGMLPLSCYRPDVDALRAGTPRIVVALGEQSTGLPVEAMGMALAQHLGSAPCNFPGDHMGFEAYAEPFADRLHQTLGGK